MGIMENVERRYLEDVKWGLSNYFNLMKKYPDKWVAIVDRKIVSAGENIEKVELDAEKRSGRDKKNIPVVFVERGAHIY